MKCLIVHILNRTLQSFWFIPAVLITAAVVISFLSIWIDHSVGTESKKWGQLILTSSPEGARSVLSTIAGSTITVAGVILSTTIVVLTLASQQYGPRLLRNFIEDRPSQFVIGSFAACFIYSILILRNIRSGEYTFVPQLSILLTVLAALACICLMIYFVHHVSLEIQVQSIMARVYKDLRNKIDHLFPQSIGHPPTPEGAAQAGEDQTGKLIHKIYTEHPGYLQTIRDDLIMDATQSSDAWVRICLRPGEFVFEADCIAEIHTNNESEMPHDARTRIQRALVIGRFPTSEKDVLFPIQQLEEIAVRALSAGINDPHTALECIDYLASAMKTLANRSFPEVERYDADGHLRIRTKSYHYKSLLEAAFKQIHHHGSANPRVVCHLFSVLGKLAQSISGEMQRRTDVVALSKRFLDDSESTMTSEEAITEIRTAYRNALGPVLKEIPTPI